MAMTFAMQAAHGAIKETSSAPTLSLMKTLLLLAASTAFVSGCATSSDCGNDWYSTGQRDGRAGAFPQADLYARRCGGAVNVEKYNAGYRDGYSERPIPVVFNPRERSPG